MRKEVPYEHENRLYGDKLVPHRIVRCAEPGCDHEDAVYINKVSHGLPENVWNRILKQRGWAVSKNQAYCRDHDPKKRKTPLTIVEDAPVSIDHHAYRVAHIPEPVPEPTPQITEEDMSLAVSSINVDTPITTPPAPERSMTPEVRRKINRAIFDNWDEAKNHYLGDMSDQKLSAQLSVPRAWVKQVRVDNFGDSGANEEFDTLREELKERERVWIEQLAAAQRAVEAAVDIVGKLEAQMADMKGLRRRLEKIEASLLPRRP